MTDAEARRADQRSHLVRMRVTWALFVATVPASIVAGFLLPSLRTQAASPVAVTLLAVAGSLWIALTAERDARGRLGRAKRAYAVHGDTSRLLRDHWLVFLIVSLRLELVVACCVLVSVWGVGPRLGLWFALLGGALMLLSWPTARKTRILIERGEELRRTS